MNKHAKIKSGFTLIELLVTIAIIAILVGLITGIAGVANRKSAEAQARSQIQSISTALEEYKLEYGVYPEPGASDTIPDELSAEETRISQELKDEVSRTDPWGRDYIYADVTKYSYTLKSLGMNPTSSVDDITSGSP
jgi:type II secretion system protein G